MTALLIDIGNSTTVFATYSSGKLQFLRSVMTVSLSSEIFMQDEATYDSVVVSSVVPDSNDIILKHYPKAFFVTSDTISGIRVGVSSPSQVGADRLVTALAAYNRYKAECLIVDSGTAITFERVSADGVYLGGAIVPGMGIASQALHDYTAQIPLIWVEPRDHLIGGTTKDAVEAGLFHGYYEMINGMIRRFRAETPGLHVIGAGNGLSVFGDGLDLDDLDEHLQLKGLAMLADDLFSKGEMNA